MADYTDVQQALFAAIQETTEQLVTADMAPTAKADTLRALSEAFAWVARPDVPRGGSQYSPSNA